MFVSLWPYSSIFYYLHWQFLINHFCLLFEKYFLLTCSMSIYVLGDCMSVVNKYLSFL